MIIDTKLMPNTLIDYAIPCINAEKALKDAHWAVLEKKYELAISKTLEAIESATLMHAALIEMSREH
jgi:hypothetical protein